MTDQKEGSSSGSKPVIVVAVVWAVLTIATEILLASINFHPYGASREARISDDAFDFLMYLAAPIFVFVIVAVGYTVIFNRSKGGDADEDGPPIRDHKVFTRTWLLISTALAILVIITPGFTGLDELRAEPNPDMVIDVRGERWNWNFTYQDTGVETQDKLVIPVDTRILFRVTAADVLHSFWIPAFRIKIDAVPGRVTETMVTAEKLGTFADDETSRVQCAELCGVGHARMWSEVEVMSKADFDAWLTGAGG